MKGKRKQYTATDPAIYQRRRAPAKRRRAPANSAAPNQRPPARSWIDELSTRAPVRFWMDELLDGAGDAAEAVRRAASLYGNPPNYYSWDMGRGNVFLTPTPEPPAVPEWAQECRTAMQFELDRSPYKRAAVEAGFSFGPLTVQWGRGSAFKRMDQIKVGCVLTCVCGRKELAQVTIRSEGHANIMRSYDLAAWIHFEGAFSLDHLLDDGYKLEDAERISTTYAAAVAKFKAQDTLLFVGGAQ
jgi:hypothetical protein